MHLNSPKSKTCQSRNCNLHAPRGKGGLCRSLRLGARRSRRLKVLTECGRRLQECARIRNRIPKEFHPKAQGCESASYPGNASRLWTQPRTGLRLFEAERHRNPCWGWNFCKRFPRVGARAPTLGFRLQSLWDCRSAQCERWSEYALPKVARWGFSDNLIAERSWAHNWFGKDWTRYRR